MYELMTTLYKYNAWAMEQMFMTLHKLTSEQYTGTEASGNGSIQATLAQMMSN